MATFTPPTVAGVPTFISGKNDTANRLWSWFGSWAQGQTVWKDQNGEWHQNAYPYQGGGPHYTHDRGTTTVTTEDGTNLLQNAQVVYLGGHVYELTAEEEADLIAGGFGDYIT